MVVNDVSAVLKYALNRGFQIHPDALGVLESVSVEDLQRVIKEVVRTKLGRGDYTISGGDIAVALGIEPTDEPFENECRIVKDPTGKTASAEGVLGFGDLFSSRYEKMRALIAGRAETKSLRRISGIKRGVGEESYVCGLVWERIAASHTRPGKLVIEDPSGFVELTVPYNEDDNSVKMLMTDQFVMARIVGGKNGLVVKEISVPDIAMHNVHKSTTSVYAVFLSDLHVGSRFFMKEEFNDFLMWLASDEVTASRVGYVLMCGDVIDGVGVYPNQNKELVLHTVEEQLAYLDELVAKIPERIKVIITPGNHDPGRKALPQPAITRQYAPLLWKRPNVFMAGNPAVVLLNGVQVLMYHGQSIDDIVKVTPNLSYEQPIGVMKHLLQARHLSPIYGGTTPIAPESEDMMVVDDVPDIFHAGHVHIVGAERYRGVLMINSGTWQSRTPFQESVGVKPSSGYAVLVDLKTHKATTRYFGLE